MMLIKSISGIRGIVNNGFDNDTITQFAIAFSNLQDKGPILIARDGRSHGLKFLKKLSDILLSKNRTVIDCGVVPTPTAQYIVAKNNYSGGIIITASHNPTDWNGLKFIDHDGCFLNPGKSQILLDSALNILDNLNINDNNKIIDYHEESIREHLDNIINLSVINLKRIQDKKYKVVIDAVNSSASKILPLLLDKLNCKVIPINCDSNGEFTRGAEPLPANLSEISKTVIDNCADFGIATDPDGDRLAIIDEYGSPIGEESTLIICCDSLLRDGKIKAPIITNLSTSMAIDKLANHYNVNITRSKVGEIHVVNEMKKVEATIGGEGNGGVILSESHHGRDSLVATALLLNRLSMENITMNELYKKIPHYKIIKDFIKTDKLLNQDFIHLIKEKLNPPEINELDGIKLIWPDKWIHIRKSNTEPIIRFYSEAEEIEDSNRLIATSKELFNS